MPHQLQQIVAFCSPRYNETRDHLPVWPGLIWPSHLPEPQVRVNRANDVMLSTGLRGDLLDFLSKQQTDPDLAKAAKEVLEHIVTVP